MERDSEMTRTIACTGRYLMFLSAVAVVALLLTGCKELNLDLDTVWTSEQMSVDGDATEWADLETTYFDEQKLLVGLSNDSDNLYILIRFGDPSWIQTMRMGSLTVWLDKSGKKSKGLGIRYFGGPEPGRIGNRDPSGDIQITPTRLTVMTGDPEKQVSIPTDGSKGPAAAFRITSQIYTCEMSIPLLDGSGEKYGIEIEPGQALMLGLELKVDREQMVQSTQRGAPAGGMMGGRGGGMMGGMSRGRSGMPKEQKIWIETVIAEPPYIDPLG